MGRPVEKGEAIVWTGGTFPAPVTVSEDGKSYQPEIAVWLQLPTESVVGLDLGPVGDGAAHLVAALQASLAAPRDPKGVSPSEIVVASAEEAAAIAAVVGKKIAVRVGSVSKLKQLVKMLFSTLKPQVQSEPESYFAGGRVPADAVAALFESAAALRSVEPVFRARTFAPFGVVVPKQGIANSCVVVTGNADELWVFDDTDDFRHFAGSFDLSGLGTLQRGLKGRRLSLHLSRAADLPKSLRREALSHGWQVAANAYPRLALHDLHGHRLAFDETDVRRVTACALAVAAFAALPSPAKELLVRVEKLKLRLDGRLVAARVACPHPLLLLPEAPPAARKIRQPRRAVRR